MSDNTGTKNAITLVNNQDQETARRIKMLLPYGSKLTDDNALALAAYSRLHGLDPFNGETYFLVKEKKNDQGEVIGREEMGVYPGIKGKRKKAKEQLQKTNQEATYKIDYTIVGPDAVGLKPQPGEIAMVVEAQLRDTVSTEAYLKDFYQLQKANTPADLIKAILGKPPVWVGYGVVKSQELRYIKQSPMVLAKKRAESDATNQRFDLPFSDDALADYIAPELVGELENGRTNDSEPTIVEGTVEEIEGGAEPEPGTRMTREQAMADLGFGDFEHGAKPAENTMRNMAGPKADQAKKAEPAKSNGPEMTLDQAMAIKTSEGITFGKITSENLAEMSLAIERAMAKPQTAAEQDICTQKLQAIKLIVADRATRQNL